MRWWLVGAAAGCAGADKDTDEFGADPPTDPVFDTTDETTDAPWCAPDVRAGGSVPIRPDCAGDGGAPVHDPWLATVEWTFTDGGESVVSPVIGQLTDDNGDGVIDALDVPDVVFTSYTDGHLYIVSGDGSGLVCSSPGWDPDGGVIVADVDGDGLNEVVGAVSGGRIQAVDGACQVEWTTAEVYDLDYVVTTAADLDGDGVVEVIAGKAVVDGRTGAPIMTLEPESSCLRRAPFTGDFDQDGLLEIMLGNTVFSSAGEPLWSATGSGLTCFGGVADLDDDPEGEIFLSFGSELQVYEHDGTLLWTAPLVLPNPGPPCAGDLDGDGEAEIVAPNGLSLTAYEGDGTEKWSVRIDDNSGSAGCSVFDLDGDGTYEVLYADETAMRVYDGSTGAVRFQSARHRSVTFFETPTVADVDGDGAAEIVVASSSFPIDVDGGITVLGHGGAGWPSATATWGLHDFSGTNQLPDGSIPRVPDAPWLAHNLFRGQPSASVPGAPNLVGEVLEVCSTSCAADGLVRLSVQVANDGGAGTVATTMSLSTVAPGGIERLVATAAIPPTSPGAVLASVVLEVPVAEWTGEYVVRVDDDGGGGSIGECHEDDNEIRATADLCP